MISCKTDLAQHINFSTNDLVLRYKGYTMDFN